MPGDPPESVVEVRVEEVIQLFDTLDPFPFRERDLDKDAEEYIVSWARELPHNRPIKIIIHAPASEVYGDVAPQLEPALNRYFSYRAEAVDRDLRDCFEFGWRSLAIGLAALAACVLMSTAITRVLGVGTVSRFFEEVSSFSAGWPIGNRNRHFFMIGGRLQGAATCIAAWPERGLNFKPCRAMQHRDAMLMRTMKRRFS